MTDSITRIHGLTLEDALVEAARKLEETIARHRAELPSNLDRIRSTYEAVGLLVAAGFNPQSYTSGSCYLTVSITDLPRLYKAIGSLRVRYKDVADGERGMVKVTLKSERFPGLSISYTKQLPPESRCRIEHKAELVSRLVCNL